MQPLEFTCGWLVTPAGNRQLDDSKIVRTREGGEEGVSVSCLSEKNMLAPARMFAVAKSALCVARIAGSEGAAPLSGLQRSGP